jgi:hypothetical protein
MLIIRGTSKPLFKINFSYTERVSSLAEQTRKPFHRWLSQRGNDFSAHPANAEMFKIQLSQPKYDF